MRYLCLYALAALRFASGWVRLTDKQSTTKKNSGVDGSLTHCGDAQKESENKAFIQVFHPIQSVKSTNKVTLA